MNSNLNHDFFLPNFCSSQATLFLIIGVQLLTFVFVLIEYPINLINWGNIGLYSLFTQGVAISSAIALCIARQFLKKLSLPLAILLALLCVMGVSVLSSKIAWWFKLYLASSFDESEFSFILRCTLICMIITVLLFRYFFVQHQWSRKVLSDNESKIQALQARIHPHFLFNSMNSIASLIRINPDKAENAIEDLCDLMRTSLRENSKLVNINDELEICKRYINIESLRLTDRLKVLWNTEKMPTDAHIPPLSIQPLIENAIYHGIQPRVEGGEIKINIHKHKNNLQVIVTNPLPDNTNYEEAHKGNKIALDNTINRLNTIYGPKAYLHSEMNKRQYIVTMGFPLQMNNLDVNQI